jgi:hypothetical protein
LCDNITAQRRKWRSIDTMLIVERNKDSIILSLGLKHNKTASAVSKLLLSSK